MISLIVSPPSVTGIASAHNEGIKMKHVTADHACYDMSASHAVALRVKPSEPFCLETRDCYSDKLKTTRDVFTKGMWSTVNPATGPVHIEGTKPGQVLAVRIDRIELRNYAVMRIEEQSGALGAFIRGAETTIHPIRRGRLRVSSRFSMPINPMIGVIGTAPTGKPIPTGTPGEHGGNMDCAVITAGSTVYLPIQVPGALLMAGDIHAVMGDGEVCICGAEVSGNIFMRAKPTRIRLPTPCVETGDHVYFIGSAKRLDDCESIVLKKAHTYLTRHVGIKPNEATRVMSLTCHLQVCQVVDPLKTMRFAIPKTLLHAYGFETATG